MPAKKSGRRSLLTYLKLTLGATILIGLNYVFTKLFELLFGKNDPVYVLGVLIVFFFFVGFFTVFLWWSDEKGRLAVMMGARDEDR